MNRRDALLAVAAGVGVTADGIAAEGDARSADEATLRVCREIFQIAETSARTEWQAIEMKRVRKRVDQVEDSDKKTQRLQLIDQKLRESVARLRELEAGVPDDRAVRTLYEHFRAHEMGWLQQLARLRRKLAEFEAANPAKAKEIREREEAVDPFS